MDDYRTLKEQVLEQAKHEIDLKQYSRRKSVAREAKALIKKGGGPTYHGSNETLTRNLATADIYRRKGNYVASLNYALNVGYSAIKNYKNLEESDRIDGMKYAVAADERINRTLKQAIKAGKGSDIAGVIGSVDDFKSELKNFSRSSLGLEATAAAFIALISSIFFLSFNITGNAIGNQITQNYLGVGLFFIGLLFGAIALSK